MRFANRQKAGRLLAAQLATRVDPAETVVLALPRGGVAVGFELAGALRAPLDVFLVRKLGVPGHEELAMGAIAEGGFRLVNREVVQAVGIGDQEIDRVEKQQRAELTRQEELFRKGRLRVPIHDQVVVVVDDGLATGATMQVAVQAVRAQRPQRIVVAVPVAPQDTCRALERFADEVVCLHTPQSFASVGGWYENFEQITDREVCELLDRSTAARAGQGLRGGSSVVKEGGS